MNWGWPWHTTAQGNGGRAPDGDLRTPLSLSPSASNSTADCLKTSPKVPVATEVVSNRILPSGDDYHNGR